MNNLRGFANNRIILLGIAVILLFLLLNFQPNKYPEIQKNNEEQAKVKSFPQASQLPVPSKGQIPSSSPTGAADSLEGNVPVKSGLPTLKILQTQTAVCGNGVCDLTERCDTCATDCGCKAGEYCSTDNGVCYNKEVCGDNTCTTKEKADKRCCQDCGCPVEQVCSLYSQKCLQKATIPDSAVAASVASYMNKSGFRGGLLRIYDAYYKDEAVKAADIDCKNETGMFCLNSILVDNDGLIVENYISN